MQIGKVKVARIVCAVDCGVAVNPNVIRAQMEGCIGFGLGALYYSEVEVKGGRAVQRNFDTYRALRIQEMLEDVTLAARLRHAARAWAEQHLRMDDHLRGYARLINALVAA